MLKRLAQGHDSQPRPPPLSNSQLLRPDAGGLRLEVGRVAYAVLVWKLSGRALIDEERHHLAKASSVYAAVKTMPDSLHSNAKFLHFISKRVNLASVFAAKR